MDLKEHTEKKILKSRYFLLNKSLLKLNLSISISGKKTRNVSKILALFHVLYAIVAKRAGLSNILSLQIKLSMYLK